jgi:transcriptional regulator
VTEPQNSDVVRGTLDLLILKTLSMNPNHGWGICQRIQELSSGILDVNHGSLYPALQRLEHRGWITSWWGTTENNRRAKYYRLTSEGLSGFKREAASWRRYSGMVDRILEAT